jgi:phosphatidylinositol-4,5-bisphosphate 3-kinase
MHYPQVSLRFGLLLEAYLRGSPNHMTDLMRQLDSMNKMRSITELLQGRAYRDKDKGRDAMRNLLSQKPYQDVMCDAITILNPKLRVGNLKVQECRFYDSK